MRILVRLSPVCLLWIVVVGCGGGGGGTSALPIATTLRAYAPGDNWRYDLTGSASMGGLTATGTGTLTMSASSATVGEVPGLGLTEDLAVNVSTGQKYQDTVTLYVKQDTNGDLLELGDNQGIGGSLRLATTPQLLYPGVWSSTTSIANRIDFTNGDSEQKTLTVQGTEVVTTPIGVFTAWKTTESYVESDGDRTTTTSWWVPQTGAPVKLSLAETRPDGSSVSVTALLISTNVPIR